MYTTQREQQSHSFVNHDDESQFYRHFPAIGNAPKGSILLFHRGHEHSARMMHLVDELNLPEYEFFAWDARGHGNSPGQRGYSPSFGTSIRDIQTFLAHLKDQHQVEPHQCFVVGQSVGAVLVAAWVHDYAPQIRGMSLASPAFDIKLYAPFAKEALGLAYRAKGLFFVNSYVKAKFLTHDAERIESFNQDPLITRPIAVNVLLGLYQTAKRVVHDAQAITVPTQLLLSGEDFVVKRAAQDTFYQNLGSSTKARHIYDGFFHDTLGEKDRADTMSTLRTFILECFERPHIQSNLTHADQYGYTADEARALASAYPKWSWQNAYWQFNKWVLSVGGKLSSGIALGNQTGFDSGSSLDYVYRNLPSPIKSGILGRLGKSVDQHYLNAPGWVGIRQRKINLEALLALAISQLEQRQSPIHILDIAAGHGRYILDAIQKHGAQNIQSAQLRDFSELNVAKGQDLIAEYQLGNIAQFHQGDAFDANSVADANNSQHPVNLAVVSGLYELFSDNSMIQTSLEGLSRAVNKDGYLIYTNQPWHPQLEYIARVLTSHRQGQAWIMRRRTQAEIDQLVEAAGFKKLTQRIDEGGIFTVCLAQKVTPSTPL